ncbi:fused isobutyryl-CoA mutase/GTPase IcmF [Euzebya tangerina]|uniref:fused isobutyryl-CoA mutase/GTPase IcmF n=1 Tax=Euzebya tangerina TaxID=591198 RepID=UPI000E30E55A|nr:fused isobutyryl-CoA mutase/GTPase IcmF [Euzebya tangerina]
MSSELHVPANAVRIVTAGSLFDGHDAAINIMRRILQSQGAEVIHLGHDRSVAEVVAAAIQEDAQGVAVSSYQGGHVEYFTYLVQQLAERGAAHIKVYGGGGGVIVPEEIELLHSRGVTRIFSPEDGQRLGLPGMINQIISACDVPPQDLSDGIADAVLTGADGALGRTITHLQAGADLGWVVAPTDRNVPVLGITGTGGAGKSSLTDELVRRVRRDYEDKVRVAVLAIDPSRRRGGGALLGDRIRMNTIEPGTVFFRSLATRQPGAEVPDNLDRIIAACKMAGHDLVIVETPGIGQGDAAIVEYADTRLYVMTPEFGAASQLEKIDMLDFADIVAINKFERRGAEDALRDVGRQMVRNREAFGTQPEEMPVYGTSAARFDDDGVTALYQALRSRLQDHGLPEGAGALAPVDVRFSSGLSTVVPGERERYLAEIAQTVRGYHDETERQAEVVRRVDALETAREIIGEHLDAGLGGDGAEVDHILSETAGLESDELTRESEDLLDAWPATVEAYTGKEISFEVRGKTITNPASRTTLSGNEVRRVALPTTTNQADLYRFLRRENLPGHFPYTAGVFPLKRDGEAPARMFAGEGDPFRTNRRFHLLAEGQPATRLSTAFDSVTLYGRDPEERPDVYGKVGTSGVSIATLDDMKELYRGFDLCDPTTSVSMTINGPAPTILAFFLNTALDQQVEAFVEENGRQPDEAERAEIAAHTWRSVRGTVQADILKEDQGQNTCIFSTEFALRCMGDIQQWFIDHEVRNFYSVSISGYHIAEAGANPISQLAFTLANGFTYVESYLARGMDIDDFAPNLSFFFSNGMDAEYTVLGRVARRIWSVAMRERYGANERSQKLKYHIQTSGRSLHAQEMHFNDIRTTLQALCAIYDNTNSLHTNAYDEAVTTPTGESVRRALAIQMIIDQEWGLAKNENPLQGSYIVEELTDLVEEAVLSEFEAISNRGGVLGAMETGYQRGKIQDESMLYEHRKHEGTLPIIGVNTFLPPESDDDDPNTVELMRATEEEKRSQLQRTDEFHRRHGDEAPAQLAALQEAAVSGGNTFAALMEAVRHCSLGQITEAFFEVGGQYRRNV